VFQDFKKIAEDSGINYTIASDDLQSWLDAERPLKQRKVFSMDQFNTLDDIYQFLDDTQQANPEKVTIIEIGKSYEGRPLKVAKISTNDDNPAIFIEANIHAREWISSATATWIINEFVTLTDPELRAIVDSITWYILPVTNPDGYQFTWVENRLWRKTRSVHNILMCRGADPNRNFGFNFRQGGASNMSCSDTFSGPVAFSEPETKAVMDFFGTIANRAALYLSFHCAAQTLLYPMGHTASTELVPNAAHLHAIAEAAIAALTARHGTLYTYGNTVTTLYQASGTSPDHAYGFYKTPLAYTYEFREGIDTPSRFILPPEEIEGNSEEVFDSIMALIRKAKELHYFE